MRNDFYDREREEVKVAYTIERQLKTYAKVEENTERHQILWHAWNQNKKWLGQLLEWTLPSFPSYSYHNATHADSVLYNIERILGEDRIRKLSATDCFMLLHVTYMHDIGMSISAEERIEMMGEDRFLDLIERLEEDGDADMKKAVESVMQTRYTSYRDAHTRERPKKVKKMLQEKLDVYYGLGQLMAEYQRGMHAEKVKERMHKWTLDPEQLGNSFAVSGIPLRLFLRIADCAAIHTTSGIEPILALPQVDSGYVMDIVHPRFVAVMLQLGDALDMDNDRFNPFMFQFAGNIPRTSTLHFKKHQAIRQLNITPEAIQIHADCDSQEVLRLIRMECESIEEILKNASYHWTEIAPAEMTGCLPTLNHMQVLLDGQRVPVELIKAQFNISQMRAFRLLEGANVYGGNFVFLREVIQNAIDASKLQCWEDYIYKSKMKEREILQDSYEIVESGLNTSEKEILSEIDVWEYPIELYFDIGVQIRNEEEKIEFVPLEEWEERKEREKRRKDKGKKDRSREKDDGVYGIRFTVRDHGTGISKEDLIKISNVGSSYEEKKHFIDKMPDWLKPTGQFGIGLQSVFLVVDTITARTYTRSGEKYEITFNKVSNGSGGYINVKPLPPDEYVTFGTTFEIFINNSFKRPHAECWRAWNTESEEADRFMSNYEQHRPLRHSKELLAQIIMYIDSLLGENLFPIYAKIRGNGFDKKHYDFIKKSIKKLVLEADVDNRSEELNKEEYISWLFKAIRKDKGTYPEEDGKNNLIIVDIKDGIGALDCEKAKLYIWNGTLGVFARFGCSRLLSAYSENTDLREEEVQEKRKTRIYLKGIYVQSYSMYQDSELLELIDIKGGKIKKEYISINRNEFTRPGNEYLKNEVYPAIIKSAKMALVELNEQMNRKVRAEEDRRALEQSGGRPGENGSRNAGYETFNVRIMDSVAAWAERCAEEKKSQEINDIKIRKENQASNKSELEETVLSAIGLSFFLRVLGKERKMLCEKRGKKEDICYWDILLNDIVEFRACGRLPRDGDIAHERDEMRDVFDEYLNTGMMHKMGAYFYGELERNGISGEKETVDYASLLSEKRKIGIICMRYNEYSKWFYVPVILHEEGREEEKNAYEVFRIQPRNIEEEMKLQEELEGWADNIFRKIDTFSEIQRLHVEYGENADVQYTLNYMLSNIPTIAVYANKKGNVRINVLSVENNGSVFFNKNMKRLILKKAGRLYREKHANYFVTTVWRSYECISLKQIPSSVCTVHGAFIARQQGNRMLLPVSGENMSKLFNITEEEFFKEIKEQKDNCEKLKNICTNYLHIYEKLNRVIFRRTDRNDPVEMDIEKYLMAENIFSENNTMGYAEKNGILRNYWQALNRFYKEKLVVNDYGRKESVVKFEDIEREKPDETKFQQMLLKEFFEERDIRIGEDQREAGGAQNKNAFWEWLLKAIRFIDKYRNLDLREWIISHPQMEEFKSSLWGSNAEKHNIENKENMVSYVMKNTAENMSEKQVESCYEKMLDDIVECVIESEIGTSDEIDSYIDSLF